LRAGHDVDSQWADSKPGHTAPYPIFSRKQNDRLANLKTAIRELPHVWIFDNDNLRTSFRQVVVFENGQRVSLNEPVPEWVAPLL
jgi:predicted ABC-type ATPase